LKTNIWKIASIIAALLMILLMAACRPEPVAPGEGQVIILNPSAGETINSATVTINVFIDNFKLVDNGQANQIGEGHLIYYQDITPPLVKGQTALTDPGSYAISSAKTYTWENVGAGPHNFWVQLVNNDNTPLEPPAAVRVPVTIAPK
jgi:hypothetical protein